MLTRLHPWLPLLVLGYVWFRLIDHLRIEWSLNEQYNYGFVVPFLCAYLLYRRWVPASDVERSKLNVENSVSDIFSISKPGSAGVPPAASGDSPNASVPSPGNFSVSESQRLSVSESYPASQPTSDLRPLTSDVTSDLRPPTSPLQSGPAAEPSLSALGSWPFALRPSPLSLRSSYLFALGALLFAFLLTRWVEIANPDWRLVSWVMAIEVLGLTLLVIAALGGRTLLRQCAFPIAFFLVAVPWPTFLEHSVIQTLTRLIIAATIEFLHLAGTAALAHGNVIETAGGFVDVDEACSGIRSLQSALMLALFFGEWHRFTAKRRLALVGIALGLALLFNLLRTLVLSSVAANRGAPAIQQWHDPAGIIILVGCFTGIWLAATWLARSAPIPNPNPLHAPPPGGTGDPPVPFGDPPKAFPSPPQPGSPSPQWGLEPTTGEKSALQSASPPRTDRATASESLGQGGEVGEVSNSLADANLNPDRNRNRNPLRALVPSWFSPFAVSMLLLVIVGELAIHFWYASAPRVQTASWAVHAPGHSMFNATELPKGTRQILRYNASLNGTWNDAAENRWQLIYLRWNPGRVAVHLARNHTPEICLPAAGRKLQDISEAFTLDVYGLNLSFRCFTTAGLARPMFVFYTLWEDGAPTQSAATDHLTWRRRLEAVRQRRRNPGQRVLQIALTGPATRAQAEQLLRSQLPHLISIQ